MSDPTQEPAERIAMIASTLRVTHSAEDTSGWERWTLGNAERATLGCTT